MPLYEYECQSCGQRTETLQRMAEAPLTVCPECGGPLKKLVSRAGFAFKGSGWYVTDYAGKKSGESGGSTASKAEPAAAGGAEGAKTESGSKETKSKDGDASPSPSTKTAASS